MSYLFTNVEELIVKTSVELNNLVAKLTMAENKLKNTCLHEEKLLLDREIVDIKNRIQEIKKIREENGIK